MPVKVHTVFRGLRNFEPSRGICPLPWNFNSFAEFEKRQHRAQLTHRWEAVASRGIWTILQMKTVGPHCSGRIRLIYVNSDY